ncbi:cell wall hydrolase domain protein [Bacteriophage DSS3_PM1]|nr:cell wall hydrolase domain protein [Bacteriophage DSS3_PM1]
MTPTMCLAMALYFEVRGEMKHNPHPGYAVAEVIMNRVEDRRWPDNVCAVIQQDKGPKPHDCQFSFYCDGKSDKMGDVKAREQSIAIAKDVLAGERPLGITSNHYHTDKVNPSWNKRMEFDGLIGGHLFFTY